MSLNEMALGIPLIICAIVVAVPFIGALFMAISIAAVCSVIWNIAKGIFTWNIYSTFKVVRKNINETGFGFMGLVPGVAFFVTIIELVIKMPLK